MCKASQRGTGTSEIYFAAEQIEPPVCSEVAVNDFEDRLGQSNITPTAVRARTSQLSSESRDFFSRHPPSSTPPCVLDLNPDRFCRGVHSDRVCENDN